MSDIYAQRTKDDPRFPPVKAWVPYGQDATTLSDAQHEVLKAVHHAMRYGWSAWMDITKPVRHLHEVENKAESAIAGVLKAHGLSEPGVPLAHIMRHMVDAINAATVPEKELAVIEAAKAHVLGGTSYLQVYAEKGDLQRAAIALWPELQAERQAAGLEL